MGIEIPIDSGQRMLEKRENKRYKSRGTAKVRKLERETMVSGRILDISGRGCLLQLSGPNYFMADTLVDMSVHTSWVDFRALGSVRHNNVGRCRIGISFVKLTRRGESRCLN